MQERVLQKLVLNPPPNILKIVDQSGLDKLTDYFARVKKDRGGVLGWDVETTPVKDFYWRKLRTMQFGDTTEQYVIDLRAFCDNSPEILYNALGAYGKNLTSGLKAVVECIRPVLETTDFLKVGVNLGFEYECHYWQLGLRTQGFFDCSMVEKCIYAGYGGHASMKNYAFYSMESMVGRYFGIQVDKGLQESFSLDCELTDDQLVYATLDTRYPLALRQAQLLVLKGCTYKRLLQHGNPKAKYLEFIDPILFGDNLEDIARIENDAIGAFIDMHVHGERMDETRWNTRVDKAAKEFKELIANVLDPIFIPIVGLKSEVITDQDIEAAQLKWKAFNKVTAEETELLKQYRILMKAGAAHEANIADVQRKALEAERKETKELLKKEASALGKQRTKIKNLAAKCEGEALVNYGSDAQVLALLKEMKGLKGITSLDDDSVQHYKKYSVVEAMGRYHKLGKEIGTYGYAWTTKWVTKAGPDEGWMHPGDGRLHCTFNQYDAETGRSSSEKPNGQNLPKDKEVRSSFIADAPNESIRISDCCNADTYKHVGFNVCTKCELSCQTHAEEYRIITADMSGAELRIIAELANDPIWISAFARGEDVHSVGTEILYAEKWPLLALPDCAYFRPNTEEDVAKNPLRTLGAPARQKCNCPEHKELRDNNKSTNFLLAYGGGPDKLAGEIGKSREEASALMELHESKFPLIWKYLEKSGCMAQMNKRSFDMFGRRRLFPEPTRDRAKEFVKSDKRSKKKLELSDEAVEANIADFQKKNNREPNKEELHTLSHREPTDKEISRAMMQMQGRIGRQGKNHSIQGTNATVAKIAMGSGYCNDGKPFLWHTLPKYRAILIKFVHDELVVQAPAQHAQEVAELIGDAFRRAAAMKMVKVIMEFDFNIATYWKK